LAGGGALFAAAGFQCYMKVFERLPGGELAPLNVAVVIPCFRVRRHILQVLSSIGPEVSQILVVDDACPEKSGRIVKKNSADPRVRVIFHENNQGVGGAMVTGYREALRSGADIIVKLDGDGQMDATLIPDLIAPLMRGEADFVKCNRFYHPDDLSGMPLPRLLGNSALSFISKVSTGYWNIMDPTNGFTAITAPCLRRVRLEKLSRDYFFETDLIFRLYLAGAVIAELPQKAVYANEQSSLSIPKVLLTFPARHLRCLGKRIFYSYFLREFNLGTVYLVSGALALFWGVAFGFVQWVSGALTGTPNLPGTVMLAAIPVVIGVQLLLSFLQFDVARVPVGPARLTMPAGRSR
jgi:dolichol-phosphate mannosyltransferase